MYTQSSEPVTQPSSDTHSALRRIGLTKEDVKRYASGMMPPQRPTVMITYKEWRQNEAKRCGVSERSIRERVDKLKHRPHPKFYRQGGQVFVILEEKQ